jgi:NAD(P)H-hydrate epimerase
MPALWLWLCRFFQITEQEGVVVVRLVTAQEMRELDQKAISSYGIPSLILMENAGLRVVETAVFRFWEGKPEGKAALVLAGPGNNGGDGLVVARHLSNKGVRVAVFLTAAPENYQGSAAVNYNILTKIGLTPRSYPKDEAELRSALQHTDLVIDAVFGSGFKGTHIAEPLATLFRMVNESGKPVLAVDLPSGLEADTGRVANECIRATATVTFGLPKIGLYLEPGASYAGEVIIGDISFPPELCSEEKGSFFLIDQEMVAAYLPPRLPHHHKGTYGHVVVIGGAPGYTGAVALASNGALRSGAGLVTAAVPRSLYPILASKLTEAMTRPLSETKQGCLARGAMADLGELLGRANVLAVGPGLGRDPETGVFLRELLEQVDLPVVLDADALNLLAQNKELLEEEYLEERRRKWILTPHPGEMARLLGLDVEAVQADRIGNTLWASQQWGTIIVLKGSRTVVGVPDGRVYINPTGNPGLATGGSGDVLTGLIAGFVAQGMGPVAATTAGVFVHGLAADRLAARMGMPGMVAGDLLEEVPFVLKELYQIRERRG